MARVLAYVDAVPGRLYPLVATLIELGQRGHHVGVRCGIDDVERLRALGLDARPLRSDIERFEPDDWRARTRFGALSSGLGQFGQRARFQLLDLEQAIEAEQPDVLFVDEGAWGAAATAERSGLPWAFSIVSPVPLPSRDAPPFGLGLAPRHDPLGRLRDRLARRLTLGTLERVIAKRMNPLRAELGLRPVRTISDVYLAASVVLAYTAEPFEYPRSDWPANLRLVGPGLWEPPAEPPGWLDRLAPLLERAVCVVCHAGMGITQKALAHGVPVVAVPFGRDQPEVARRVEVAGAGVRLPARKLSADRLRQAVYRAIELRAGAERIAAAFAAAGGPAAAADALDAHLGDERRQPRWHAEEVA